MVWYSLGTFYRRFNNKQSTIRLPISYQILPHKHLIQKHCEFLSLFKLIFFSKSISCLLYITRHPFWHNSYPTYLMYIWRRVKGAINTGNSAFLSENIRHGNGRYACCSNFLMLVFISTKFNHYSTRLWDFRKEEAPNQHSLGTTELYKAQNEYSWILWLWQ